MLSGLLGQIHFVCSILSLLFGTLVLLKTNGTFLHRVIGYLYVISMMVVLATSFMLHNLSNFGILHWFSIISSTTILLGMLPLVLKFPKENYMTFHISFMYWSVIGLYCALAAEIFTRIPFLFDFGNDKMTLFYILIGVSFGIVGAIGSHYFKRYKTKWFEKFGKPKFFKPEKS